jgi:hypothetical protein
MVNVERTTSERENAFEKNENVRQFGKVQKNLRHFPKVTNSMKNVLFFIIIQHPIFLNFVLYKMFEMTREKKVFWRKF